eukprot:12394082-Prorocentrum_lima.AAC.1
MTSSLVGSEMCIRDSCLLSVHCGKPVWRTCPRYASRLAAGGLRALGPMPVSYTHLTLPTICSV